LSATGCPMTSSSQGSSLVQGPSSRPSFSTPTAVKAASGSLSSAKCSTSVVVKVRRAGSVPIRHTAGTTASPVPRRGLPAGAGNRVSGPQACSRAPHAAGPATRCAPGGQRQGWGRWPNRAALPLPNRARTPPVGALLGPPRAVSVPLGQARWWRLGPVGGAAVSDHLPQRAALPIMWTRPPGRGQELVRVEQHQHAEPQRLLAAAGQIAEQLGPVRGRNDPRVGVVHLAMIVRSVCHRRHSILARGGRRGKPAIRFLVGHASRTGQGCEWAHRRTTTHGPVRRRGARRWPASRKS
jgi:hypothetical protein